MFDSWLLYEIFAGLVKNIGFCLLACLILWLQVSEKVAKTFGVDTKGSVLFIFYSSSSKTPTSSKLLLLLSKFTRLLTRE